jgi:hypothetical protein
MKWTVRDWTSVVIGWLCAVITMLLLPAEPWRLVAIFAAGFLSAWIARLLIPH